MQILLNGQCRLSTRVSIVVRDSFCCASTVLYGVDKSPRRAKQIVAVLLLDNKKSQMIRAVVGWAADGIIWQCHIGFAHSPSFFHSHTLFTSPHCTGSEARTSASTRGYWKCDIYWIPGSHDHTMEKLSTRLWGFSVDWWESNLCKISPCLKVGRIPRKTNLF